MRTCGGAPTSSILSRSAVVPPKCQYANVWRGAERGEFYEIAHNSDWTFSTTYVPEIHSQGTPSAHSDQSLLPLALLQDERLPIRFFESKRKPSHRGFLKVNFFETMKGSSRFRRVGSHLFAIYGGIGSRSVGLAVSISRTDRVISRTRPTIIPHAALLRTPRRYPHMAAPRNRAICVADLIRSLLPIRQTLRGFQFGLKSRDGRPHIDQSSQSSRTKVPVF